MNKDWNDDIYKEKEKRKVKRIFGEGAESYELRTLGAHDNRLIRAKIWGDREPYYLTYQRRLKDGKQAVD